MSTVQDFENAPVGATAKKEGGLVVIREGDETDYQPWMCTTYGDWFSNEELVEKGYTLVPSAPTTAQEALDLAWDLAHPVKVGQVIPKGAKWMKKVAGNVREYTMGRDYTVTANDTYIIRTLDPPPEPGPAWLDAPAVVAYVKGRVGDPQVFSRGNNTGTQWVRNAKVYRWDELIVVDPLYPREDA